MTESYCQPRQPGNCYNVCPTPEFNEEHDYGYDARIHRACHEHTYDNQKCFLYPSYVEKHQSCWDINYYTG